MMPKRKNKEREKFEVKEGSVVVTVYYTPIRGRENWTVTWVGANGRERRNRATRDDAAELAIAEAKKLTAGKRMDFDPVQAAEYHAAVYQLEKIGMTLPQAVAEIVAAKNAHAGPLLDGALLAASRSALKVKKVSDAAAEFLATRKGDVGKRHSGDLRSRVNRFAGFFDGVVCDVTTADIEDWLKEVGGKSRTRENNIRALSNFFRYCRSRGYLPRDWDALADVPRKDKRNAEAAKPADPHSPEEFENLLRAAEAHHDKRMVVYLVLRGFFGVRDAECKRIADCVRSEHIVVEAKVAKVQSRRLVPMHGKAGEWVRRWFPKTGQLVPRSKGGTFDEMVADLFIKAKVPRRHNGLRDAFISYRMAQMHNEALVADEAGNSPRKVRDNYRAVLLADGREITKDLADQWFGISPQLA